MSPAQKQQEHRSELAMLFDELSKSCAPLAKVEGSFGGKSFEDALQETFVRLIEEDQDTLPAEAVDRKAHILSLAAGRYIAHKRREREHGYLLARAAHNLPTESLMERLLVDDENRRIIALAWIALEGRAFDRRLLFLLASGVDYKDNQLLAVYLESPISDVVNGKKRLFRLLRIVRDGLSHPKNHGDVK
jgi:DNA-directed RNA polymerase specialized sigma24 family protein